ncbi:AEC family transporter [Caldicellulosiruptor morganii]|uniref:AEC family transporter n=1 Tax=Caldicellulosiruptor morganii TaxID=1387555 RepID=A0ABY7BMN9_9FIRM|nr:AEC family transporter [Caldicellulosiruptor morganii]WAM34084.1 AEC family transporter [Caldicellulosiruptor morganii]
MLQTFISSIQGVLVILFVLILGYYLTKIGWFDSKVSDLFAKIVVNISLPLYMIANLTSTFTKEELEHSARGLLIPFLSILLSYCVATVVARFANVKIYRRGLFAAIFSLSNSIFVGLPMSLALFGDVATPYTLLYYMANTTMWWTLGVYGIIRDNKSERHSVFSIDTLKRIFNPPLIGFLIGVVLVLLGIRLPKFAFDSFKMVGGLTTPLSIFCIGITMYEMGFKSFKFDRDSLLVFSGRFLITPFITWSLSHFIPVPKLMRDVFIIMSAMPVMINSAIISRVYNGDYEFATAMITYSTLFSVVIMPFLMVLIKII